MRPIDADELLREIDRNTPIDPEAAKWTVNETLDVIQNLIRMAPTIKPDKGKMPDMSDEKAYRKFTTDVMEKFGDDFNPYLHINYMLSCIADELAELNRVNSMTIKEVVDDLTAHGLVEEPKPIKGENECFICGKPLEHDEHGGVIVDSEGNAYYSCKKCRKKFDALVSHFVFPGEVFC